jgi:hypothetical protein
LNTDQPSRDKALSDLFFSLNLKLVLAIKKFEEGDIDLVELAAIRRSIMTELGIPDQITRDALEKSLSRFMD